MTVAMEVDDLDALVEHRPGARDLELLEPALMRLPKARRNDRLGQVLAKDRLGAPAKGFLGLAVPRSDFAALINGNHRIERRVQNQAHALFAFAQGPLRFLRGVALSLQAVGHFVE